MTERKPQGASFEDWIERQIRTAEERGEFDNLPGAGKPLPRRDRNELEWVASKLASENLDASVLLPPSLALPKEVEDLPARVRVETSEQRVRALAEDLNRRIRDAHAAPQVGPPMRARPVDVDEVVRHWKADRAVRP